MITIYGVYRSRALRNIWACEEMGIPYRVVPVIQVYRVPNPDAPDAPLHTRSASFLKVNPGGQVPVMDDGGLILTESLAINLWLARRYPSAVGTSDLAESARFAQWTLWGATEVEYRSIQILMHRVSRAPAERDESKAAGAVAGLRAPFAVLDAALAETGQLVGGRFTVADINVAEVVRYAMAAPELFERAPRVKAWLEACHQRPAWKKIFAEREKEPV